MIFESIIKVIRELYGSEKYIPLHEPVFIGNEKKYLSECVDSTFVSSVGKFVDLAEENFANYLGVEKAVAVSNGTSALHMGLLLAGVKRGDEVITQALTFIGTVNPISYCAAEPIFLDVSPNNLGLCPFKLKDFLDKNTSMNDKGECVNKKTGKIIRACVPVHIFGFAASIKEIVEICHSKNIKVIEDAAEAVGSELEGKKLGTFGDFGTFSFNGNKIITSGGGGILATNDLVAGKIAKHLTTTAKVPHQWNFHHDQIGYNYRMPNVNAALLCAQFEQLPQFLNLKRGLAKIYLQKFKSLGISMLESEPNCHSNFWLNTLILNDASERDEFLKYGNSLGIQVRPVWELICDLPMYKDKFRCDLTVSRSLADRLVNIPSSVNYKV